MSQIISVQCHVTPHLRLISVHVTPNFRSSQLYWISCSSLERIEMSSVTGFDCIQLSHRLSDIRQLELAEISILSGTVIGTEYRKSLTKFTRCLLNFDNHSRNAVLILENQFFDEDLTVTKREKVHIFAHASWDQNDPLDGLRTHIRDHSHIT